MTKPRIGRSMLYTLSEPFNKMIKQLDAVNETYVEIVDEGTHTLNSRRVAILKKIAEKKELKYSVHAPFADINPASPSKPLLKASMKRLKQSMQYAHDLDAYLWVFHPGCKSGISSFYPEADWRQNQKSIKELHATAEGYDLKIAIENLPEKYNFLMKKPEDFNRFYKETGLEDIGIVLDTGHANLEGQIEPFLQKIPKKIAHVHISDNHGEFDEHLGLGFGAINWQKFAKTIKESGFSGTLLAEAVFNVEETLQRLRQLFA
ncbi:MAG: sugar phosphate isomerase/epimerase [Candidatus Bathyarchaeota archaeon]|nr:sugar phosphate isomerase/epimerase [Candidatus Bathyarchaeota archaeon]